MAGITLDTIDYSAHSIKIVDGDGDELAISASGELTVIATDLDIRDLINTQDSIAIGDETNLVDLQQMDSAFGVTSYGFGMFGLRRDADTSPVSADGDAHPLVFDDAGRLKVDAFSDDLDIRDLINTQDSIAIGDETNLVDLQQMDAAFGITSYGFAMYGLRRDADTSPVSADGDAHPFVFNDRGELKVDSYLDDVANTSVVVTKVSVDTTVGGTQLIASALANRREITIQNLGSQDIYIQDGTGATVDDLLVPAKSSATYQWGPNIDVYAITASGTADIRVAEAA